MNVLYEAAAGSGKTTKLIKIAREVTDGNVLITTYTDENTNAIRNSILQDLSRIPENIDIIPWYTFLLRHGVKPFLWFAGFGEVRIKSINLTDGASARYTNENAPQHYSDSENHVYADKLSKLAIRINHETGGSVIEGLAEIYDTIIIDEAQDLAGYDLDFVALMLKSSSDVIMAEDFRQTIYLTSNSNKNSSYQYKGIRPYIEDKLPTSLCPVDDETLKGCYRCSQPILNLADSLYPNHTAAESIRDPNEQDDILPPIHLIKVEDAESYVNCWEPVVLRDSVRSKAPDNLLPLNFGLSKGSTYDRVLIYPTNDIEKWILGADIDFKTKTKARLYVAITRARYSVAFAIKNNIPDDCTYPLLSPDDFLHQS